MNRCTVAGLADSHSCWLSRLILLDLMATGARILIPHKAAGGGGSLVLMSRYFVSI